ncbi:MAG: GntR family transcriptional regulator [Ardenticatenaceae bacterium]|nr:GntR family transcriptional regulator [Ardenticatenaceae bacterium]MCB9442932.1 GntR family transcriptional regulator [Ardenticatenaceae bacterium]
MNRTTSLSLKAYEDIKHRIVTLELSPGTVIDEISLQQQLNLGRTPIREALQRLAQEQLVTIIPRRGMFVTEIGITDLQRLFEVRLVLERLAVQLAAQRGTAVHWDQMQNALNEVINQDPANINPEHMPEVDEKCHQIIFEATDNAFLKDTLATLYSLNLRLWYLYLAKLGDRTDAVVEYKHIVQHQHILDALRQRNGELAEQLMAEHIELYYSNIRAVMIGGQETGSPQPTMV